ncbi:hypothetical protein CTI18_05590 [Prevotella intermedia]|uniref:Uncharacterized protein n=1 Tax=Prevotella intermedia TaxID=28131 RepID=A0A2G8IBM3_PREIN|nr:hypothetical protein CTI18_05590 [Prevotella intermedia]
MFYGRKEENNSVNIFRRCGYCVTCYASVYYKTYCFAFQKRRFCNAKQPLSQCQNAVIIF